MSDKFRSNLTLILIIIAIILFAYVIFIISPGRP